MRMRTGNLRLRQAIQKMLLRRVFSAKSSNLSEEQKNAEVRAMSETYNKQVDLIDFYSLEPIVDCVTR